MVYNLSFVSYCLMEIEPPSGTCPYPSRPASHHPQAGTAAVSHARGGLLLRRGGARAAPSLAHAVPPPRRVPPGCGRGLSISILVLRVARCVR